MQYLPYELVGVAYTYLGPKCFDKDQILHFAGVGIASPEARPVPDYLCFIRIIVEARPRNVTGDLKSACPMGL